jgi:hypothetical protein
VHISDPKEMDLVLAFFRKYLGREVDIATSIFEGLTQYERMRVAEVGSSRLSPYRVRLISSSCQRQLEIDLHHYSFTTVSPDHKAVEMGRLLGGNITLRLTASEIK